MRFFKRASIGIIFLLIAALPAHATVASSTSRVKYTCSGGSTFAFTFGVGTTSEIQVIKTVTATSVETTLTETTDYTISATNNDYSSGGTVTTTAACAAGNTLTILRNVPLTQDSDFTEGMPTLYETFEDGLDKLTRITQQQQEEINRAPKLPESFTVTSNPMPEPAANNYLGWNSDATALENKITALQVGATPADSNQTYYVDAEAVDQGDATEAQTIASLLTSIGTSKQATIVLAHSGSGNTTTYTIGQNVDWSAYTNVTFRFERGAVISHGNYTVNIPNVELGRYQMFTGTGQVTVSGRADKLYPEMLGAIADGDSAKAAANLAAIQMALNAFVLGGTVEGAAGQYYVSNALTVPVRVSVKGQGRQSTYFLTTHATANVFEISNTSGIQLTDFQIGGGTTGWGIWADPAVVTRRTAIDRVEVNGPKNGIKIGQPLDIEIGHIYLYGAASPGAGTIGLDLGSGGTTFNVRRAYIAGYETGINAPLTEGVDLNFNVENATYGITWGQTRGLIREAYFDAPCTYDIKTTSASYGPTVLGYKPCGALDLVAGSESRTIIIPDGSDATLHLFSRDLIAGQGSATPALAGKSGDFYMKYGAAVEHFPLGWIVTKTGAAGAAVWTKFDWRLVYGKYAGAVSTSGTGEDIIFTSTVIKDTLGLYPTNEGGGIKLTAFGRKTGGAGNKTISAYFGATAFTVFPAANNTNDWSLEFTVNNTTAANAQVVHWKFTDAGTVTQGVSTAAISTTADVVVKITGECIDAGDAVIADYAVLERI